MNATVSIPPFTPGPFLAVLRDVNLKTVATHTVDLPPNNRLLIERVAVITEGVSGLSNGATVEVREFDPKFPEADVAATLETALTGAQNDLTFTAATAGAAGNAITVAFVDPSANDATLSVTVTGSDIVVNLATGEAGAITSTAADVQAAIEGAASAAALVTVSNKAGNDGTGVVTALAETELAGGKDRFQGEDVQDIVASVNLADDSAEGSIQDLTVAGGRLNPEARILVDVTAGATATAHTATVLIAGTLY